MTMFGSIRGGYDFGAHEAAAGARGEARSARRTAEELSARLDRTLLAMEGMWTIMREKLDLTDEELVAKINEIDLADGQLDGKAKKSAVTCPSCNRTISPRFPRCMWCGQAIVHDPFA